MNSRSKQTQRADALALAGELQRLAEYHRLLERALCRTRAHLPEVPIDLGHPNLDRAFERARAYGLGLDRFDAGLAREDGIVRNVVFITDLIDAFDGAAASLARRYEIEPAGVALEALAEERVLSWLARILPAGERSRFVAEAQGNLGDCERWWQRIDTLVCLALGMPRLAWMMRRGGRRRRV
jgi:hypothetical protein